MSGKINLNTTQKIHFIGIGGVGISALARLILDRGKEVSGTNDIESPETLDWLRAQGVPISLSGSSQDLPLADLYVYSDAWLTNNPAILTEAKNRGVPTLSYFEALGLVTSEYYLVAIAGAHGKTTTTAMMIDVFEAAGLDPTAVVGSLRVNTKSNFRSGKSKYFIVEADEYRRHFLNLAPTILAITNIDADHLDYYKDLEDIISAFRDLALKVPPEGYIVCNPNDPNVSKIIKDLDCKIIDYTKYFSDELKLSIPGEHNRSNAAVVLAVAKAVGIKEEVTKEALYNFSGTWRRFEFKGELSNGALVYDDYAHHPTEIKATLAAAKEKFPNHRIIAVFQPHLYSRTKLLLNDFAKSFKDANEVWVAPIYAAREAPDPTISSEVLVEEINKFTLAHFGTFVEIEQTLKKTTGPNDLIITIGAGNVCEVADALLS